MNPIKIGLILIFLSQIVFAFVVSPIRGVRDYYPFFNWSLFAKVRKNSEWPMIYIHAWEGETFAEPMVHYDFLRGRPGTRFLQGQDLLLEWYKCINKGDEATARLKRQGFEQYFFGEASSIKYSIRIQRINLFRFFKGREIESTSRAFGPFWLRESV